MFLTFTIQQPFHPRSKEEKSKSEHIFAIGFSPTQGSGRKLENNHARHDFILLGTDSEVPRKQKKIKNQEE